MVSAVKLSIWEPSTAKPLRTRAHKIRIFWEIIGETIEINGEQMPRLVSKEFTLSLNEKSKLRQALQSWRGKAFTAEELQGFDLRKVLGTVPAANHPQRKEQREPPMPMWKPFWLFPAEGVSRRLRKSHGLISMIRPHMGHLKSCPGMYRRRSPRRKTLRTPG